MIGSLINISLFWHLNEDAVKDLMTELTNLRHV